MFFHSHTANLSLQTPKVRSLGKEERERPGRKWDIKKRRMQVTGIRARARHKMIGWCIKVVRKFCLGPMEEKQVEELRAGLEGRIK